MKKALLFLAGVLIFASLGVAEEGGESIFKSLGCGSCHHSQKASSSTPSLADIAAAYQGKPERLSGYFRGEEEAHVIPEKAGMMKRYVQKTQALSDAQRTALADFILSQH